MNILISTTIGYNIGDEIICLGVKTLLKELFPSANYFIYNRNPDLWHGQYLHGNYFIDVPDFIDLVVLAGSPEFYLEKMNPLYNSVKERPVWAIGVGWGVEHLLPDDTFKNVIKKDNYRVIARSAVTQQIIDKEIDILPCPSLLYNKYSDSPKQGVCFVGDVAFNHDNISNVICYTPQEFLKNTKAKYFSKVMPFLKELTKYETVVTTRLHTAFAAFANNCKNVTIPNNGFRIETAMNTFNSYREYNTDWQQSLEKDYLHILYKWKTLDKL